MATFRPTIYDPRPPMVTSGLRIGTPALATRGFGAEEFTEVAEIIAAAPLPGDIDAEGLRKRGTDRDGQSPPYPGNKRSTARVARAPPARGHAGSRGEVAALG